MMAGHMQKGISCSFFSERRCDKKSIFYTDVQVEERDLSLIIIGEMNTSFIPIEFLDKFM